MNKEVSLPIEWINLLLDENPLVTYQELTSMSCGEVYDLLEIQSCRNLRAEMVDDIQKNSES